MRVFPLEICAIADFPNGVRPAKHLQSAQKMLLLEPASTKHLYHPFDPIWQLTYRIRIYGTFFPLKTGATCFMCTCLRLGEREGSGSSMQYYVPLALYLMFTDLCDLRHSDRDPSNMCKPCHNRAEFRASRPGAKFRYSLCIPRTATTIHLSACSNVVLLYRSGCGFAFPSTSSSAG